MVDTTKKITLNLVGLDGNAFYLLGAFRRQALREGWTDDEISAVSKEARSGDYNHLLMVLSDHCQETDEDDE